MVILFFCFFETVFADSDVNFICSSKVMIGGQVDCTLDFQSIDAIYGIQAKYKYDDVFSYVQSVASDSWNSGSFFSANGFLVLNLAGASTGTVFHIKFLVSANAEIGKEYSIQLMDIMLSNGSNDVSIENKNTDVKILSVFDFLNNISVGNQSLEIKDGVENYTVVVDNDTTVVHLSADLKDDSFSFVDGYGPRDISNLQEGDNVVYLKIKNTEDSTEFITYTFNIQRLGKDNGITNVEEQISNPKTGNLEIIIVSFILIFSFGMGIFIYKKCKVNSL